MGRLLDKRNVYLYPVKGRFPVGFHLHAMSGNVVPLNWFGTMDCSGYIMDAMDKANIAVEKLYLSSSYYA
jgi:hypothetical protein